MTKAKKALSLVLAAVMLLGVMSVAAFAADAPTGSEATISFNFDRTSYAAGDTVTLEVALQSNYFVGPTAIPVQYKTDAVSFTSGVNTVTPAAVFGSVAATDMAVNTATPGEVYVALTPLASQNAVAQTYTNAATIFTVTFTAVTAIADPAAAFGVLDDQKTMTHLSGKLFVGTYATSDIRSTVYSTGQTLNFPVLEEAAGDPNTLVLKDSYANKDDVVIDTEIGPYISSEDWLVQLAGATDIAATGFIYGIETVGYEDGFMSDTYDTLSDALTTVLGDDYLRITPSDTVDGYESTGTTIEVLDADGTTVLETYYFVYFGDVNGDALVDINDAIAISSWDRSGDTLNSIASVIACDYNGDTGMDPADAILVKVVDAEGQGASQISLAADFRANSMA